MMPAALCAQNDSQVILVDVQIRLLAAMAEADRSAMVKTAGILLKAAAVLNVPVLYTEQYPKGLGPTVPLLVECLPATARAIEKTAFSCCAESRFREEVRRSGRRQIVLLGQEAHICVLQTALGLAAEAYRVFVVEEGVCARQAAHKKNALSRMRDAGIVITNLESVLFEWLRDSSHPDFQTISQLIR